MDFDSPTAAQKAVAALKTSGVQAQMAKVRDLVFQLFSQDLCTHDRFGGKKNKLALIPTFFKHASSFASLLCSVVQTNCHLHTSVQHAQSFISVPPAPLVFPFASQTNGRRMHRFAD